MKINSKYFQQLLNNSNLSQSSKDFIQKIINKIKLNNDNGTDKQYSFLKRLESGNWKFKPTNESTEYKKIGPTSDLILQTLEKYKYRPLNAEELKLIINKDNKNKITNSNINALLSKLLKNGYIEVDHKPEKREHGKFSGAKYKISQYPPPPDLKPSWVKDKDKNSNILHKIVSIFKNGDKYNSTEAVSIIKDKFDIDIGEGSMQLYLSSLAKNGHLETDKPKMGDAFKSKTYKYWKREDGVNTLGIS